MSPEHNKAIVRRYLEEAWNKGNVGILDELMAPTYARYMSGQASPLNREGQKQRITSFHSALPDLHLTIEDLIAEGDKVVFRITVRGTQQGMLMGISPTSKQVTVTAIDIAHVADGKIVDHWVKWIPLVCCNSLARSLQEDRPVPVLVNQPACLNVGIVDHRGIQV